MRVPCVARLFVNQSCSYPIQIDLFNQNVKLTCQRLTHVPSNFLRAVLAASEACVARVASADAFGG